MAKKSLIAKAKREPKFGVQKYNRCPLCGRPKSFYSKIRYLPSLFPIIGAQRGNTGRD